MLNRFSFRLSRKSGSGDEVSADTKRSLEVVTEIIHKRYSVGDSSACGEEEYSSEGEEWVRNAGFSLSVPVASCLQVDDCDVKSGRSNNGSMSASPVAAETCTVACQTEPKISMEHELAALKEQVKRLKLEAAAMEVYYSNKDCVIEKQRLMIGRMHDEMSKMREEAFAMSVSTGANPTSPGVDTKASQGSPNCGNSSDDDEYQSDSTDSDNEEEARYNEIAVRKPVKPLVPPVQTTKSSPLRRSPSSNHGAAFGMIHY